MTKTLLSKTASVFEIQSTINAAFHTKCGCFFEAVSSFFQSKQQKHCEKWIINNGKHWFDEVMYDLFKEGFLHYKNQTAWNTISLKNDMGFISITNLRKIN